jgi:hypothetical protein
MGSGDHPALTQAVEEPKGLHAIVRTLDAKPTRFPIGGDHAFVCRCGSEGLICESYILTGHEYFSAVARMQGAVGASPPPAPKVEHLVLWVQQDYMTYRHRPALRVTDLGKQMGTRWNSHRVTFGRYPVEHMDCVAIGETYIEFLDYGIPVPRCANPRCDLPLREEGWVGKNCPWCGWPRRMR